MPRRAHAPRAAEARACARQTKASRWPWLGWATSRKASWLAQLHAPPACWPVPPTTSGSSLSRDWKASRRAQAQRRHVGIAYGPPPGLCARRGCSRSAGPAAAVCGLGHRSSGASAPRLLAWAAGHRPTQRLLQLFDARGASGVRHRRPAVLRLLGRARPQVLAHPCSSPGSSPWRSPLTDCFSR